MRRKKLYFQVSSVSSRKFKRLSNVQSTRGNLFFRAFKTILQFVTRVASFICDVLKIFSFIFFSFISCMSNDESCMHHRNLILQLQTQTLVYANFVDSSEWMVKSRRKNSFFFTMLVLETCDVCAA